MNRQNGLVKLRERKTKDGGASLYLEVMDAKRISKTTREKNQRRRRIALFGSYGRWRTPLLVLAALYRS